MMAESEKEFNGLDCSESTKHFYNNYVDQYIANINKAGITHVPELHSDTFANHLIKSQKPLKILEVGCGYGRDAARFSQMGMNVIGTDYARSMLVEAQKAAPSVFFLEMDMRLVGKTFLPNTFDGIWACATIIHLPKKDIPGLFTDWFDLLIPGGVVYVSVKQGSGETFDPDTRYGGIRKFYAFYSEEEIINLLKDAGFLIIESGVDDHRAEDNYATHPFIHAFAQKPANQDPL